MLSAEYRERRVKCRELNRNAVPVLFIHPPSGPSILAPSALGVPVPFHLLHDHWWGLTSPLNSIGSLCCGVCNKRDHSVVNNSKQKKDHSILSITT